jgi:hypothetical protein
MNRSLLVRTALSRLVRFKARTALVASTIALAVFATVLLVSLAARVEARRIDDCHSFDHQRGGALATVGTLEFGELRLVDVLPGRRGLRHLHGPGLRKGHERDLLVVTGPCGGSLLGRHLDVEPRCREALDIAARFHVHAAIDSSDGLSLDVARLMRASGTRGVIDLHRVPVHPDADRRSFLDADGVTALDHALGDGEDFELILALPPADALALVVDPPAGIAPVIFGEVTSGTGLVARTADGSMRPLQPKGWLHEGT